MWSGGQWEIGGRQELFGEILKRIGELREEERSTRRLDLNVVHRKVLFKISLIFITIAS